MPRHSKSSQFDMTRPSCEHMLWGNSQANTFALNTPIYVTRRPLALFVFSTGLCL